MNTKELDRLQRRIQAIRQRHAAGVFIIAPDADGGYGLCRGGNVTHYDSIEAAKAAAVQDCSPAPGHELSLIVVDV